MKTFFLLITYVYCFAGCTKKHSITGSWQLRDLIPNPINNKVRFHFKPDSTFVQQAGDGEKVTFERSGRYRVTGNNMLVMYNLSDSRDTVTFRIARYTKTLLLLQIPPFSRTDTLERVKE